MKNISKNRNDTLGGGGESTISNHDGLVSIGLTFFQKIIKAGKNT